MKIVVIGNGIIGLTTAYRLLFRSEVKKIAIIGPQNNEGSASLAAAAMLNSFCEVEPEALDNPIQHERFLLNRAAVPLWPQYIEQLQKESGCAINHGYGTYLIHNHAADELDDSNFDAVVDGLKRFSEPFHIVNPREIPNYSPSTHLRAAKAIFIPNEGWVNPVDLMRALRTTLEKSGRVEFVDAFAEKIDVQNLEVKGVRLSGGAYISGDKYLLSPGANFSKIVDQSDLPVKMPKIFYGIGCSILLHTGQSTHSHCVRTPNRGLACGIYSAPFDETHTIVGASNFISPVSEPYARLTSVHTLLEAAMDQVNSIFYRSQLVKVNVGWRPTSDDTLPVIGNCDIANLTVATGTKRDGLHCSPKLSQLLASLVLSETVDFDLSLYKPQRERRKIYTREKAIADSVRHTMNAAYQHGFKPAKNRMLEDLQKHYTREFSDLHDKCGAKEWGIPPELVNMYRYGHIT